MENDLTKLPKPEKKVISKVLSEKGMTLREIGLLLGCSDATAMRYAQAETPEKLKQFEAEIEQQFKTKEDVVAAKALARLDEKIASSRINEALEVYKAMREKPIPSVLQQFNVTGEMNLELVGPDESKT